MKLKMAVGMIVISIALFIFIPGAMAGSGDELDVIAQIQFNTVITEEAAADGSRPSSPCGDGICGYYETNQTCPADCLEILQPEAIMPPSVLVISSKDYLVECLLLLAFLSLGFREVLKRRKDEYSFVNKDIKYLKLNIKLWQLLAPAMIVSIMAIVYYLFGLVALIIVIIITALMSRKKNEE